MLGQPYHKYDRDCRFGGIEFDEKEKSMRISKHTNLFPALELGSVYRRALELEAGHFYLLISFRPSLAHSRPSMFQVWRA
jgi:hypothetical protein